VIVSFGNSNKKRDGTALFTPPYNILIWAWESQTHQAAGSLRSTAVAPKSAQGSNPDDIRTGSKVNHPKWGIGTVVTKEGTGENAQVKVAFPGLGIKQLVLAYANLTLVE
jgi:hypothetical protein